DFGDADDAFGDADDAFGDADDDAFGDADDDAFGDADDDAFGDADDDAFGDADDDLDTAGAELPDDDGDFEGDDEARAGDDEARAWDGALPDAPAGLVPAGGADVEGAAASRGTLAALGIVGATRSGSLSHAESMSSVLGAAEEGPRDGDFEPVVMGAS